MIEPCDRNGNGRFICPGNMKSMKYAGARLWLKKWVERSESSGNTTMAG